MTVERVSLDLNGDDSQMLQKVDEIISRFENKKGAAIPILQSIQTELGYVPKPSLKQVAMRTGFPASDLYSIVTFYAQFRMEPIGENLIQVCHGTACHLAGAEQITDSLVREIGMEEGKNTSSDGKFTVEKVACLGCCSLAPVMTINGETFGRLTPEKAVKLLKNY